MTNFIVNKNTVETYLVIADTMAQATEIVQQGKAEVAGLNIGYQVRPQTPPQPVASK